MEKRGLPSATPAHNDTSFQARLSKYDNLTHELRKTISKVKLRHRDVQENEIHPSIRLELDGSMSTRLPVVPNFENGILVKTAQAVQIPSQKLCRSAKGSCSQDTDASEESNGMKFDEQKAAIIKLLKANKK